MVDFPPVMLFYWRVMDPNLAPLPLSWRTAYSKIHPREADFCNLTLFLDSLQRRIPVPKGRKFSNLPNQNHEALQKVQPLWDGIVLQRASRGRCNIAPCLRRASTSTEEMACILITIPHEEALRSLHQWLQLHVIHSYWVKISGTRSFWTLLFAQTFGISEFRILNFRCWELWKETSLAWLH